MSLKLSGLMLKQPRHYSMWMAEFGGVTMPQATVGAD